MPLGRQAEYPGTVEPRVLFPVARSVARKALGVRGDALPFAGVDVWNAWELSWLDARGRPRIAVAELRVPCESPNLIESKSLKLYLGGFAMVRFDEDARGVRARIADDVSAAVGAPVEVALTGPNHFQRLQAGDFAGASLDARRLDVCDYGPPRPEHLGNRPRARPVEESLVTHLFRSKCPVTGQPDWASMQIRYRGPSIDRAGLLRYLVSYREHADFHEACVERIFMDVRERCSPLELAVYARFLRRGGIDINPWRTTPGMIAAPANVRSARQ
jgi:7-cyano-7-deazaguanine reductase